MRDLFNKHRAEPDNVDLTAELCYGLNIRSYHGEAAGVARQGLTRSPAHAGLYYELIIASSLDTAHILEEILNELQELLENDPKDRGILRNLALTHYYMEQDEEAEDILMALLDEYGERDLDRQTFEILAQLEYTRQDMEQCIVYCDKAIDRPGPAARMVRLKGLCLQDLGKIEQAVNSFRFALQLEPNFVWACHSLGSIYIERGHFTQALRYFGMATFINPQDPGNLFIPAEAYMDMGQYSLAAAELEKLLLLKPERRIEAEVHNALGYIQIKEERPSRAMEHLQTAVELEPELSLAYFNLGQLAVQQQHLEVARKRFRRSLELDPQLSESWVELGFLELNNHNETEAEAHFTKALEVDPLEAQANLGLAKIYQGREDHENQLLQAKKAYECDPDHSEICNNLGIAHECCGELDDAEEAYVRALELDDTNAAAANNLGYLYERKMEMYPEQSETYRKKALEAWKERLRICVQGNKSTDAATTHLIQLGMNQQEIENLARSF
ncbi:MAG: tetratricopeptide repeat protein [Acidobacteriota bacterium]|nr:tetratricopeptide repeat protein [Acidobacteriota bacterium]